MGRPSKYGEPTVRVTVAIPKSLADWLTDAGPDLGTALVAALRAQHGATGHAWTDGAVTRTGRRGAADLGTVDPACRHPINLRIGSGCGACGKNPL